MRREATQEKVAEFLQLTVAFQLWIDGGWGVDALLGTQSRAHSDLDIVIDVVDLAAIEALLAALGYKRESADASVFISADGLAVDVHCVRFDARGYGTFDLPDGREWPFPTSAFQGRGSIAGIPVKCMSAEAQVHCHAQGYEPQPKDFADMQALQNRFGVVLPLRLCGPGSSDD